MVGRETQYYQVRYGGLEPGVQGCKDAPAAGVTEP